MTPLRLLRFFLESAGLIAGFIIIPFLPRRLVVALSNALGSAASCFAGRDRRIAEANVRLVFGDRFSDRQVLEMVRDSFRSFALVVLDLFWFSVFTERRVRKYVHADREYEASYKEGSFVYLSAHFGNWEAVGLMTAMMAGPLLSVVAAMENPVANAMLRYMRRGTGQIIVNKTGAVRVLMKALKAGSKAALVMDQNTLPSEGGIFVELFGVPAPVSMAPASIVLHAKCSACFVCSIPDGLGHYLATVVERFNYDDCRHLSREELTVRFVNVLERAVKLNPQFWMWSYKRWKYIPEGADPNKFPFYSRSV